MRTILVGAGALLAAALVGLSSGSLGSAASLVAPDAPTNVSATAGDAQAVVSWSAPASDGGSPVTGYDVTGAPGGTCATTGATSCTVNGLANGTAYTFTVTATNADGTSVPSAASSPVTPSAPATVPGAPTDVSAVGGNAQATVSWSAPASDGGSPITGYAVSGSPGGACSTTGATSCTVVGLVNGTSYTFRVTATNAAGTGPASAASSPVTPTAPAAPPGAPTDVSAAAGNAQATVSWSAPASDGGSPITGYAVSGSPGGACSTTGATSCTVVGLVNGTSYTFRVTATNAAGTGPASAASNAVTPVAPDTTRPTVSLSSPLDGAKLDTAPVTLAATATDNVGVVSLVFRFCDSTVAACSPSGTGTGGTPDGTGAWSLPLSAAVLADGHTYTWQATAADAAGNESLPLTRTFSFDSTVPTLLLPTTIVVEADGPSGSRVTYSASGSDNGEALPPSKVVCSPASGSLFGLGGTTVSCATAADPGGNVGSGSFTVRVVDTTPPVLSVPRGATLTATASGLPATSHDLAAVLASATAVDLVDPSPDVRNDAPAVFPVGATVVVFTARDSSGNESTKSTTITVVKKASAGGGSGPPPAAPAKIDTTPPGDPKAATATPGPGQVQLRWTLPADADFDHVEIFRSGQRATAALVETRVYSGGGTSFVDRAVKGGWRYRYLLASFDKTGNRSAGAVVVASVPVQMLTVPGPGATVKKLPVLRWRAVAGASYYNVQLFRGTAKLLSVWPSGVTLRLKTAWTYAGRQRRLAPGTYRWYVWPGLGKRAEGRYGTMLGQSTFVVPKGVKLRAP